MLRGLIFVKCIKNGRIKVVCVMGKFQVVFVIGMKFTSQSHTFIFFFCVLGILQFTYGQ